ncbi:hypothetical protein [Streptomyces xanthophaeus]|uniref:hypothetical protein n=1 Tax=Streptomyces xanthophaeus TaxID=67385 RepID=UPI00365EDE4D
MTDTDPLNELADHARHILSSQCRAIDMALPDDPTPLFRDMVEDVLAEHAAQQWVTAEIEKIGIRSIDYRNGMEMDLEPAREMLAHMVAAARTLLGDAPNYSETKVSMDLKVAEQPELYTFVVQRRTFGALTPHEARQQAEARLAAALDIVRRWYVDTNDGAGWTPDDLISDLEQAGHTLPNDD